MYVGIKKYLYLIEGIYTFQAYAREAEEQTACMQVRAGMVHHLQKVTRKLH